jgi:hypothetical protein
LAISDASPSTSIDRTSRAPRRVVYVIPMHWWVRAVKSTRTSERLAVMTLVTVVAIVAGFLATGGHRVTAHVTTLAIDPTLITLRAGRLPVVQVDEPF